MVEIRVAGPGDAGGIAEVHARTWQVAYRGQLSGEVLDRQTEPEPMRRRAERWRGGLEDGRLSEEHGWWDVRVAVDDDRIVGFAAVGPEREEDAPEDAGELYAIYVHPDRWGTGVGQRLHDVALEQLRDRGMAVVHLWVLDTNDRARRFYERHGWEPTGEDKTEEMAGLEVHEVRYGRAL